MVSILRYSVNANRFSHRKIGAFVLGAGCLLVCVQTCAKPNVKPTLLSLAEVVALVLENNHQISVENLNRVIEQERLRIARTVFDPSLEASYSYQNIDTPQNTQDFVATPIQATPTIFEQRNHVSDLGVQKRLKTGASIGVGTELRVLDNSLNRRRPPGVFHPENESFSGVTITQPLLRDFGCRTNTTQIRVAKLNVKIADLRWKAQTAGSIASVMKIYYDLIAAYGNMLIQQDSVKLAQQLHKENQMREAEGTIAETEVLVAEAAVFERREEAILAANEYVQQQNSLQALYKKADTIDPMTRIVPLNHMTDQVSSPDRSQLISQAQQSRYDVLLSVQELKQRQEMVNYANNQIKPRLDLVASAGLHGLDGSVGNSYGSAFDRQAPEATIGFIFSRPFRSRRAKAEASIAEQELVKAGLEADRIQTRLVLEIDTVLHQIRAEKQRLVASRKNRQVAKKLLEAEIARMKQGVSTSYRVFEAEERYSQSLTRELMALADLNKDEVDLWLVSGILLSKMGIITTDCACPIRARPVSIQARPVE